ncbi:extensin family protein [Frigidibacter sp. SD6-1]|uniref:extensin-like domain-containing protein n=1 Tax=Frigidibacter sp. SD6-1 TaxID=3032581 RepID=UPI0024E0197D|nr:extensin family protein [Frigidibacter sp. SD6-1]
MRGFRRGTKAGLAAALVAVALPALAEAPVKSLLPPVRPSGIAPAAIAVAEATLPAAGPASPLAPLSSPLPPPRGASLAPDVTRFVTPTDVSALTAPGRHAPLVSLLPLARPRGLDRDGGAEEIVLAAAPAPKKRDKASRKGSVCGNPSIKGEEIAPIKAAARGCGLDEGVRVTSVSGVALSTPGNMDCHTAEALNDWVERAVIPAVGSTGGGVAKLQVAATYACRPRNNQKGGKISEHGKGHAVDVSGLILENGKVISVLTDWGRGREGKILKAIRKAACGGFTTVLGPGSDRFHRDHLHLDTARGRGAYCR